MFSVPPCYQEVHNKDLVKDAKTMSPYITVLQGPIFVNPRSQLQNMPNGVLIFVKNRDLTFGAPRLRTRQEQQGPRTTTLATTRVSRASTQSPRKSHLRHFWSILDPVRSHFKCQQIQKLLHEVFLEHTFGLSS